MAKSKPKISVVIATYNRALTLRDRSVKSIQKQTYGDWECVVVDDGSTDDTESVMRAVVVGDPRIRYFKKENGGMSTARNLGVRNSRGEYIAFLDDDDEFLPTYLETIIKAFESAPRDVACLIPSAIGRDYYGGETLIVYPVLDPFWSRSLGNGCCFRRKVFFEDNLFFDENMRGFEDVDFNIKFYFAGQKFQTILETLAVCYLGRKRSTGGSLGTNFSRQRHCFEKFFEKNSGIYQDAGRDAWAWLCGFGGMLYLADGEMAEGRKWLWKALGARPSLSPAIYIAASFFGPLVFTKFFIFKTDVMRFLRVNFLNRTTRLLNRESS